MTFESGRTETPFRVSIINRVWQTEWMIDDKVCEVNGRKSGSRSSHKRCGSAVIRKVVSTQGVIMVSCLPVGCFVSIFFCVR